MQYILNLLNIIYENTFGLLFVLAGYIKDKIEIIMTALLQSKYFFFTVPLFVGLLGFFETFGIIGLFIPIEIPVVTAFAFMINNLQLFFFTMIIFILFIFLGLFSGYFFGKYFLSTIIEKYGKKYPKLQGYFDEVEKYVNKYHFFAFPLLINIHFARPIMAMYFGARGYEMKKYIPGCILATFAYVLPRVAIGYLFGVFGQIVFDYLKIGYKYVMLGLLILIVVAFILDALTGLTKLKK